MLAASVATQVVLFEKTHFSLIYPPKPFAIKVFRKNPVLLHTGLFFTI